MLIQTAAKPDKNTVQPLTARMMKYGQPFSHLYTLSGQRGVPIGALYIRVKPTGFLLNSSTVGDVINRGDIFTLNLEKNTLYYMKGDTPVVLREAHVVVED